MYSSQLLNLNRTILQSLKGNETILIMESISIKKKVLKRLKVGDCIYIGDKFPTFYIQKNNLLIAEANIRFDKQQYIVDTIELPKDYEEYIKIGNKRVIIKPIITIIDYKKEKNISFDWNILERVYLYLNNRVLASAKFGLVNGGYVLKIEEIFNGY